MKKILLLLFLSVIAYGQTRTPYMKLPQWVTGDTLKAGSANDTSQSNFGLNNGFARLDQIIVDMGVDNDSGTFSHIYGKAGQVLIIDADHGSSSRSSVVIPDSLIVQSNFHVHGNGLIRGNWHVGGYIMVDSMYAAGGIEVPNGIVIGRPEIQNGQIFFMNENDSNITTVQSPAGLASSNTVILPTLSGTIALTDGNQNFTDVAEITADSVTVSGKIESGTYIRINESNDSPNGSVNDADMFVYKNGGGDYYFIIKYNDGGTIRFKYMQLNGTSTTWTHATSLP